MNNPALVMSLLNGDKFLSATVFKDDSQVPSSQDILFQDASADDRCEGECQAVIVGKQNAPIKKTRRLVLDFDILEGFYDILYLLAAFIAPENDVVFYVKADRRSPPEEAYIVHRDKANENKRSIAPYPVASI